MFSRKSIEEVEELKKFFSIPLIVEGKKDREVMRKLGFEKIFEIGGKDLNKVLEEINKEKIKEVCILTDFDREGREKFKKFLLFLRAHGIRINFKLRMKIRKTFKVSKIEEINSFIKNYKSLLS